MMKRNILLFSALTIIALASCNRREKEIKEIEALATGMDSVLRANPVLTVGHKVQAEELIAEYTEYAKNYPQDSLSPVYLLRAALLYHAMPAYPEELRTLDQLISAYPETAYAQQACATGARVCEDNLRDYAGARKYLTIIKEKYPDGPYATNIDLQIEYVGDPDGLFAAIMEKAGTPIEPSEAMDSVDAVK